MRKIFVLLLLTIGIWNSAAQDEMASIQTTLMDYIEGTANGEPERLNRAFHPDFNLYYVRNDSIKTWSGKGYISNIKPGRKANRIGRIISIDYEGNAAMAKVEILMPARKRMYTDYFLLLKSDGQWRIVHKSFTYRNYPE